MKKMKLNIETIRIIGEKKRINIRTLNRHEIKYRDKEHIFLQNFL